MKTVRGQSLLQWTGKEHPDCSLLLGAERALRDVLSRCHIILDEDVRWEEGEGSGRRSENDGKQEIPSRFLFSHICSRLKWGLFLCIFSCSEAAGSSTNCRRKNQQNGEDLQEAAALT